MFQPFSFHLTASDEAFSIKYYYTIHLHVQYCHRLSNYSISRLGPGITRGITRENNVVLMYMDSCTYFVHFLFSTFGVPTKASGVAPIRPKCLAFYYTIMLTLHVTTIIGVCVVMPSLSVICRRVRTLH